MIYYIKNIEKKTNYLSQTVIKSIFFLSRLMNDAKFRYWLIRLKLVEIIWMLKKIYYLIEAAAFNLSTIIYIDYDVVLKITKQILLIISFTDKLKFRFIRVFDYLQRFNLNIRHKLDKQHIISDTLSRLIFNNIDSILRKFIEEEEFNVLACIVTKSLTDDMFLTSGKPFAEDDKFMLFITSLIEMSSDFKQRILKDYKFDLNWQRISVILKVNSNDDENVVKLSFYWKEDDLIFRADHDTKSHDYESYKLCILYSVL